MSLYTVQKFLFHLNRDLSVQTRYRDDREALLDEYKLNPEERGAVANGDLGLIYVLGANGQLLMHFAAYLGIAWPAYIQALRDGVARHGQVRAGVYAMTTELDQKVAGV